MPAVPSISDPTYGYSREMLDRVGAPSASDDFERFWRGLYAEAREVDTAPVVLGEHREGERIVQDIAFTSGGGVRLGGWLVLPADGVVERGLVVAHGYGGRAGPDSFEPVARAAVFYPCLRGMPARGLVPGIPDVAMSHVLHGIESRDTYVIGGCAADVWCAVTALIELVPETAQRIDVAGESFGGGVGALALPWDDRVTSGLLVVPTFGNHPLRITLPCQGSGAAVSEYAATHPEVTDVLAYFDAATAAGFIRIPVHVAPALADPVVPPPGQFAVANALAGPVERHVLPAGHTDYPGLERDTFALIADQRAFLERPRL